MFAYSTLRQPEFVALARSCRLPARTSVYRRLSNEFNSLLTIAVRTQDAQLEMLEP